MRKSQMAQTPVGSIVRDEIWIDVGSSASVEVTSEESGHPIESAVLPDIGAGWRAATPGSQAIRLIFDEPQTIRRIFLVFEDTESTRTQEFALRWSADAASSLREVVRQQWNFSPPDSTRETENYAVELPGVKILELAILPDKSGGECRASLQVLRLA